MKIKFRKMLLCLTSILALGIFMGGVSAENVGDMDSNISGDSGSGCAGKDSCWLYAGGDTTVYGIRISIVDGNGNLVSGTKSIDYLGRDVWTYKVNNNTNYYRYTGSKINRIAYLFGNASSSDMSRHDGTKIAKTWPAELGVLPDIYDADDPKNSNAAQQIHDIILGLDEADLQKLFFNDLGYSIPASNSMLKNHYMIVEPLTMVSAYNKKQIFYGTYYELTEKLINTYNRENSNDSGKSWIATVLDMYLPLSMYITGKENIEGYENGTYFNGRLKVANDSYTWYQKKKTRTRVKTAYIKGDNNRYIGYGMGIIWLNKLIELPTCNWSADASATTGPNGIVCCEYIANNLSEYGKTKEQFYNEHPECRKTCDYGNNAHFTEGGPNGEDCCEYFLNQGYSSTQLLKDHPICGTTILKKCKPFPTINNASCDDNITYGNIKDIGKNEDEWTCIYASAYSNDTDWQNYFLKGKVTENGIDKCSVYCREDVSYTYPIKGAIKALAGTYFTINGWGASNYDYFEIPQNTSLGFSAANLGSISTTVTRECRIYAEKEENASLCTTKLKEALDNNNLKAPTIKFSYEQPEYNNPIVELKASVPTRSNPNYSVIKTGQSYTSSNSYRYSLKTSDSYRYVVIEDGISYKNEPEGRQYYEMDEHLPIHFNYSNDKIFYEINITDLGLDNFNSLVLEGKSMPTTFKTSIETYIQNLIKTGRTDTRNVNGILYFHENFEAMLKTNGFDASSFLSMKCAKPDDYNYVCGSDSNGIYCVDKGTNTNSDNTYINFNKCINKTVDAMKTESATTSIDNDMVYKCDFNLENRLITDEGLNVMFRQISLNNPFPGNGGNGRETGLNWCYGELCGNDNDVVKKVIINNRGVESDEVYRELDPLYKITLTPALIKKIREYNDKNAYDDFNLTCSDEDAYLDEDDDGIEKEEYTTRKNCKSSFIREKFKEHFTGCGITNASIGLTCASGESW